MQSDRKCGTGRVSVGEEDVDFEVDEALSLLRQPEVDVASTVQQGYLAGQIVAFVLCDRRWYARSCKAGNR